MTKETEIYFVSPLAETVVNDVLLRYQLAYDGNWLSTQQDFAYFWTRLILADIVAPITDAALASLWNFYTRSDRESIKRYPEILYFLHDTLPVNGISIKNARHKVAFEVTSSEIAIRNHFKRNVSRRVVDALIEIYMSLGIHADHPALTT
jgi:hypothetical protein